LSEASEAQPRPHPVEAYQPVIKGFYFELLTP
jgi:hypothetical protein